MNARTEVTLLVAGGTDRHVPPLVAPFPRQRPGAVGLVGRDRGPREPDTKPPVPGKRAMGAIPDALRPRGAGDLLGPQERRIAELAGRGLSNRQIGEELGLPPRTVGTLLYRVFFRLGVSARTQLAEALRDERV